MNARMTSVVAVVDDDADVRYALGALIETLEVEVRTYASARQYLEDPRRAECDCLLLDLRMPGMSGLELQSRLAQESWVPPILFITGHGDVPVAVQAMRAGATDFLQKPFNDQVLLDRISMALERSAELRARYERQIQVRCLFGLLSHREDQVLQHLVAGKMNKVIAEELGISMKTVEDHRASIMRKLQARSFAELVRISVEALRC